MKKKCISLVLVVSLLNLVVTTEFVSAESAGEVANVGVFFSQVLMAEDENVSIPVRPRDSLPHDFGVGYTAENSDVVSGSEVTEVVYDAEDTAMERTETEVDVAPSQEEGVHSLEKDEGGSKFMRVAAIVLATILVIGISLLGAGACGVGAAPNLNLGFGH